MIYKSLIVGVTQEKTILLTTTPLDARCLWTPLLTRQEEIDVPLPLKESTMSAEAVMDRVSVSESPS